MPDDTLIPGDVSVTLSFSTSDVILQKRGEYTAVITRRGAPRGRPGEPALPWERVLVHLEDAASVDDIDFTLGPTVTLADAAVVAPCQPDIPTDVGRRPPPALPDPRVYGRPQVWPATPVQRGALRREAGHDLLEVFVCPLRYHLPSGRLELVERVELRVRYQRRAAPRPAPPSLARMRHALRSSERIRRFVANPGDVRLPWSAGDIERALRDLTALPEVEHVIITRAALRAAFEPLVAWRVATGRSSRIVTVEDIRAGAVADTGGAAFWAPAGYHDGGTRDEAEAIRAFLKWAAVNWLTRYVLLGGDIDAVPCRLAFHPGVGGLWYSDIDAWGGEASLSAARASSEATGGAASGVCDDDSATAWTPAAGDAAPWIRLDLWTNTPVNGLSLTWATRPAQMTAEASLDGSSWTPLSITTTSSGQEDRIAFPCRSARFLRLRLTRGAAPPSLVRARAGSPSRGSWGGVAYALGPTRTRVYLSTWLAVPQPAGSVDQNQILVTEGPQRGAVLFYNPAADDAHPGWRFVADLADPGAAVSPTPTEYVEVCGPAAYHGNPLAIKCGLNTIPADLYYGDIAAGEYPSTAHHDWDADDNRVYGERYGGELDGVNGLTDVQIGRVPASTADEAAAFVEKLLHYERYERVDAAGAAAPLPAGFAVSVLLGSESWYDPGPGFLDGSPAGKEDIRAMLLAEDPQRWTITRRYQDHADVPAAQQGPDLAEVSGAALLAALAAGQNVVSLSSHGSPGYLCCLTAADIAEMSGPPGVFYGNACSTNAFDDPSQDAFGELAVLRPGGAAVAYIGNTRFGWTSDNPLERAFWAEMLESGLLGEMFRAAKQSAPPWQSYSYNLLGDPLMPVWSDRPRQLQVQHPAVIRKTRTDLTVKVTCGGAPVEGARVCALMSGQRLAAGVTAASGEAVLTVVPPALGALEIVVTGRNLVPYLGHVTVQGAFCAQPICGVSLQCHASVACRLRIACERPIGGCGARIACGPRIDGCGARIACGPRIECGPRIGGCGARLEGCSARLGLRDPREESLWGAVRDLVGVDDPVTLADRMDEPAIRERLGRLPAGLVRPLRMLLARIRREAPHG